MKRKAPVNSPKVSQKKQTMESKTASVEETLAPNFKLSYEQQDVVHTVVSQRKNVLVIAKAGSGKSSTALATAHYYYAEHGLRSLLITYNSRLKNETRARVALLNMRSEVEAHSYHAVAGKYFAHEYKGAADNALIHTALQTEPLAPLDFGLVIVDEAQDMNPLYCDFVKHIMTHCAGDTPPQMLVIGDPFQRIFGFNGATSEFLVDPGKHFGGTFTTKHLSYCWRITHEMAEFVNENLDPRKLQHTAPAEWWREHGECVTAWWGHGIKANPNRPAAPGSITVVNGWASQDTMECVRDLFAQYGDDEVALVAFSLNGKRTPIKAIVDKLGQGADENWAVLQGSSNGSASVLSNKRVASTIHRMKGLERKGIVVCGMGAFIEKMYTDPLEHFNIWYVACTRAKERLVVNMTGKKYATMRQVDENGRPCNDNVERKLCFVRNLTGYVPFDPVLSVPDELFDSQVVAHLPESIVNMNSDVCLVEGRALGTLEDITSYLSRAIIYRLMLDLHGTMDLINVVPGEYDSDMTVFIRDFDPITASWVDLVKYAVAYQTVCTQYKHIWRQLSNYDEIVPESLLVQCYENCFCLLWKLAMSRSLVPTPVTKNRKIQTRILSKLVEFGISVSYNFMAPWFTRSYLSCVTGTTDILFAKDTVIGIECGRSVKVERGLELMLNSALFEMAYQKPNRTMLIFTNVGQLVHMVTRMTPQDPNVPLAYQLLHHSIRRKLHVENENTSLIQDFQIKNHLLF